VPSRIARPLVESLRNNAVCAEHDIAAHVPDPGGLISFRDAVHLALKKITVAARWSSASTPGAPSDPLPTDPGWTGGSLYIDRRAIRVNASLESLWQVIESIGGNNGSVQAMTMSRTPRSRNLHTSGDKLGSLERIHTPIRDSPREDAQPRPAEPSQVDAGGRAAAPES
jgi:hypothetical protein